MILDSLILEGAAAERALRGVGLTRGQLADPKTRVSASQVVACFRNAVGLAGDDEHFAYHAGLGRHVSSLGVLGLALLSSVDFRHTMRLAERHGAIAAPLAEAAFAERDGASMPTCSMGEKDQTAARSPSSVASSRCEAPPTDAAV
jgi:hypothetical protein